MKARLLVFIVILSILATSISADLDVPDAPSSLTGSRGSTISSSFIINNTAATAVSNVTISSTTFINGNYNLTPTFSPSAISSLAGNGSQLVTMAFTTASNQHSGNYQGTVTVTNGTYSDSFSLTVTVSEVNTLTISDITVTAVQGQNTSGTITLTNDGNGDLNSIGLSHNVPSKYNFQLNQTSFSSIPYGSSITLSYTISVPSDETSGSHSVGILTVSSSETSATEDVTLDPSSKLTIDKLKVTVDGRSDTDIQNEADGYTINKAATPLSDVVFYINLENDYSDDDNVDIDDVVITITIEDIDDGDDLEEETDEFTISEDSSEDRELSFSLPLEVEESKYNVEVRIEAKDDNDIEYDIIKNYKLEIEKENHEIMIYEKSLNPSQVMCGESSTLRAEIVNTGSSREKKIVLKIYNSDLGIDFYRGEYENYIDLDDDLLDDEDSHYETSFVLDVPDNASSGSYPITIATFYDDSKQSKLDTVYLDVVCNDTTSSDDSDSSQDNDSSDDSGSDSTTTDTSSTITDTTGTTSSTAVKTEPTARYTSSNGSSTTILLLAAVFIVLLIVVIFLFVKVLARYY